MKTLTKPSFEEEKILWKSGTDLVIGIDEVGRGAFAGPIVAAGVVFHPELNINILCDINDSKLLKPSLRGKCMQVIKNNALFWTVEQIDINFINRHGIGKANSAVFRKILNKFLTQFGTDSSYYVLLDGFHKKYMPGGIKKQKGIVKGDQKSLSIAAASILAKVYRDDLMKKSSKKFPQYQFAKNKGYGTNDHREAIMEFGESEMHRQAYINTWINKSL